MERQANVFRLPSSVENWNRKEHVLSLLADLCALPKAQSGVVHLLVAQLAR